MRKSSTWVGGGSLELGELGGGRKAHGRDGRGGLVGAALVELGGDGEAYGTALLGARLVWCFKLILLNWLVYASTVRFPPPHD